MVAPQVLVVGAGFAGISAAAALREAGCGVQLLEREARAGGRASGTARDGFRLDGAPYLVCARDRRLFGLIAASGLAERLLPLRPVTVANARGRRIEPAPPAGRRLEVARIGGVRLREALRLHRLARLERRFSDLLDPEAPERAVRLDDRSAADFARLYFGPSVLARWVEPMLGSDLLADAAAASRVSFLLARRARGEASLGTLRASPAEIAEALRQPASDRVGVEALGLERAAPELALDTTAGRFRADAVVLAVPAVETLRLAGAVLAPAEREALAAARSISAIVLNAALERSPRRKATRVRVPAIEGSPLATIAVEPSDAGGPAPPAVVALVARADWARAHLEADDAVIEKGLLAALERVFPGASDAIRFCEIRRYAHAAPHFEVGRYRQLARLAGLQAEQRSAGRRLYFAGDHWLAPTLEAAAASGRRAAAQLCADFGMPAPS